MSYIEVLLIGIGLSMDAFAVCATNGIVYKNANKKWGLMMALCFGLFQAAMPTIGYFLGSAFAEYIRAFDHIIALVLLGFIGGKMIFDAIKKDEDSERGLMLTIPVLLLQGVATSIDALAVGISFAALENVNIVLSVTIIGITTFMLSLIAVVAGKKFGSLLNNKAQLIGGLILVGIGVKIFIEHTFFAG